jgi:dolichol-phosphate mannosyltransferase
MDGNLTSAAAERPVSYAALPLVSLIICTLDESESIVGVLQEATSVLAARPHEIIVVDDSADDRTAQAVQAYAALVPGVRLLRRKGARGLASAVIAGWDMARGERLAVADGDGQHDLQLLPRMLQAVDEGRCDLVAASRYIEGESGLSGARNAMSRIATRATTSLLIGGLTDPLSGFFVITRGCYEAARPRLSGIGFKILVDVVASSPARLRMEEIAGALRGREHGQSKLDIRVIADLGALLVEKRTRGLIPARLALFGAVGLSGVVVHMATLDVLYRAASFGVAQAGAIVAAMTWNFWINNILTFRDMRLHGAALWRGLATFYVACLSGGLISELLSAYLYRQNIHWLAAGVTGALAGGLWNYHASTRATWDTGKHKVQDQVTESAATPPLAAPAPD